MSEGLDKWKPALMLVGGLVVVIGVLVAVVGGSSSSGTTSAPSASSAPANASAPSTAASPTAAPLASATTTAAGIASSAPTLVASVAGSAPTIPAPNPGADSVIEPPEHLPITADWQATKTEQALAAVQARHDLVEKEIAELDKAGKPKEAAAKRVLLQRLTAQISDMKKEIADFRADAGAGDAATK